MPPADDAPPILGLDEAGRGSVLGPLVVGGFLVPEGGVAALAGIGVRDSKALAPARRAAVYRLLAAHGRRLAVALPPAEVDRYVARGALNLLEARAFARLVRRAGARRVRADACDVDAARFGRLVAGLAGGRVRVDARHHADRDDLVVAAASIVAKVRRDAAVARLARRAGADVGSGYPSDARTVAYLADAVAGPRIPPWVRRSWRTTQRLMPRPPAPALETFDR